MHTLTVMNCFLEICTHWCLVIQYLTGSGSSGRFLFGILISYFSTEFIYFFLQNKNVSGTLGKKELESQTMTMPFPQWC